MSPELVCSKVLEMFADEKHPATALLAISRTQRRASFWPAKRTSDPLPSQMPSLTPFNQPSPVAEEIDRSELKLEPPGLP
jgi:hypothetical protein